MDFSPASQTLYYVGWRSFHHRGYLVAYLRAKDLVGVSKYSTDSIVDTEELFESDTWDSAPWVWKGASEALYELSKCNADLALPQRSITEEDKDAKWLFKLEAVFVEWYETGKLDWETLTDKMEYSAIQGDLQGQERSVAMRSFERDTAMRDQDKAEAAEMIKKWNENPLPVKIGLPTRGSLPKWITDAMADMGTEPPYAD